MDNHKENDAVKGLFNEMSNDNLRKIVKLIREVGEVKRLNYLRASNPPNPILVTVFNTSKEDNDFEVCAAIKIIFRERYSNFKLRTG